jgi:hypothetical protein
LQQIELYFFLAQSSFGNIGNESTWPVESVFIILPVLVKKPDTAFPRSAMRAICSMDTVFRGLRLLCIK